MTLEDDKIAATTYTGEKAEGIEGPRFGEKPETTLREDVAAYGLDKVYERHGRVDLVPLPSDSPLDPYNWSAWKKNLLLFQVAFGACMGPFSAAATIPAFEAFTEDFNISITQASYTVSIVILFLCSFLVFGPISQRIGRRPILVSSLRRHYVDVNTSNTAHSLAFELAWRLLAIGRDAPRGSLRTLLRSHDDRASVPGVRYETPLSFSLELTTDISHRMQHFFESSTFNRRFNDQRDVLPPRERGKARVRRLEPSSPVPQADKSDFLLQSLDFTYFTWSAGRSSDYGCSGIPRAMAVDILHLG